MAVSFRYVKEEDVDRLYALEEFEHVRPYVGERKYCEIVQLHCHMAIDEETGRYLVKLPIRSRDDTMDRYVLVVDGKLILMEGIADILYVSPALIGRLDEFLPFMREAFTKGGEHLSGRPMRYDATRFAAIEFVFPDKSQGESA